MSDECRLKRRLFYLCIILFVTTAWGQGPVLTTISDIVFRADGTPAAGTLLISWPEFSTAAGQAVAAGTNAVILGAQGALTLQLAPNAGAIPGNTVYTVVYQLDDGTVKTEYWLVGTSSPETIAEVRTVLGANGSTAQFATQQYVNNALAGKANDNAVVHLTGTESVSGLKQFAISPSFPTPVNPPDAANKGYVDSAVQNSGSGNFVSKAGDSMTGPLTLPGAPSAPNQAATKQYVDSGLTNKADLTGGVVPTGELARGTANNSLCLHGDSTWGACGTSGNAVTIQSVPVATTPPTNNQVLTYVGSLGAYAPAAGGGLSAGMQAVKYATDFAWSQSPSGNLGTPGAVTVNLVSCPGGVTGSEPQYYVYVSGTGTAEAVLVTGGTCAGDGQPGTLQFTTVNGHSAGFTVTSASSGLQEALIAARFIPGNPPGSAQAGKVVVPPGEMNLYARVSIRSSDITVDFSGSIVNCYMSDTCIFVGDAGNANGYDDITLINPRGRPMVANGQNPFVEDNAQKTRLMNVSTRVGVTNGTFSSYVQVDDDQSFLLDGLDTTIGQVGGNTGVLCNALVCNPVVYAPGPFATNPAVGWLKNLNISMQCTGNGIDWQAGNTLHISDSVIQGYSQYGVRGGTKRGGFGGLELDNVYEETGNCGNPAGAIGHAGVIVQGGTVKIDGGEGPSGNTPQFANTGSTNNHYYVVAQNAAYGASNPLYAGSAMTSGTGSITVTTPDIAGATSFDLLRVTYSGSGQEQAPFGTGNYAVATGVSRSAACANGVCTFADPQGALHSYTVNPPTYFPLLDFWPGSVILGTNQDSNNALTGARSWTQTAPTGLVAVQGMAAPAAISTNCDSLGSWTPAWMSCYSAMAPSAFYQQGALLLAVKPNADGNTTLNLKGRLNFPTLGTAPGHIITLSDSNFQKTIATANNRPTNDANDAFIGYDQGDGNPAHIGVSMGAPVSLSDYIGNVGDGTNWQERLTAGLKEFKANVQMDSNLTVAGTLQASSIAITGPGAWSILANFAPLSPAPPGKSLLGFGTNGLVQVSENGGPVSTVALLNSNGDETANAVTATQLAQTPTQCNGSYATGIQANGNANCGTASVIQLAETGQPTGIANYGLFWFDSTCHCPRVLDNNGQPIQLGLLNVFNPDANTLEESNGANPQTFRIYQTYTNSANYSRMQFKYDANSGDMAVFSDGTNDGSTTDTVHNLGLGTGGSTPAVKWEINAGGNNQFRPILANNNATDIGDNTHQVRDVYVGTGLAMNGSFGIAGQCLISGGGASAADTWGTCSTGLTGLTTGGKMLASSSSNIVSTSAILDASQFSGSDAFAQINACIAALPSGGGKCDASNLPVASNVSTPLIIAKSAVSIEFGASVFTAAAGTQVSISGSNVEFDCLRGSVGTTFNFSAGLGSGTPGTPSPNPNVLITGKNVRMRGCAIQGNRIASGDTFSGSYCVKATGTTGLLLEDNFISQCGGNGIDINNSDSFTVQRNRIVQTSGPGINVNSSSGGPYYGLKLISDNEIYEAVTSYGLIGTYPAIPSGNYELNVVSSGGWGKTRNVRVLRNTIANDFACTSGTGCDNLMSVDVCSGAGTPQATGCLGGMQVLAVRDYEVAGNLVRNMQAEGIAVSGTGGNVHDNEESLIHVNASGSVVDNGSGCVSFYVSNSNLGSPTIQGESKIHDNHCYDAGYVVQVILGQNANVDGLTVENLDVHNNHGLAVTSTLNAGIKIVNSSGLTACGGNTRQCNWTITNSKFSDNDVSSATNPFNLNPTGLTDTTGWTAYGPGGWIGNAPVAQIPLQSVAGFISGTGNTANVLTTSTTLVAGQNGLANSATSDTTNASNITSGTMSCARMPALTGDAATSPGSCATTVAKINSVAVGVPQGSANNKPQLATGGTSANYPAFDSSLNLKDSGVTSGPYSIPWITYPSGSSSTSALSSSANKATLWGVVLGYPITTTQVSYDVTTADNTTNTYDIGIVNSSGNVVLHTGPLAGTSFASSTGWKTFNWAASGTLQPGKYYLAITSSCTASCATLAAASSNGVTFLSNATVGVTTGGTLPGSVTLPADSLSAGASIPAWEVH